MSIKFYYTEEPALKALKDDEKIFAVDNDHDNKIKKKYFNATYDIIEKLLKKNLNIYEGYNAEQKIKFFIDIDYKIEEEEQYNIQFDDAKSLLSVAIEKISDFLKSKNINVKKPIILDSTTNQKFSYHLIYNDLVFDNVKSIKNLMKMFETYTDDLFYKIIDTNVYRKGYFRCINQSKIYKENCLKGNYKILETLLLTIDENLDVLSFQTQQFQINKEIKKKEENKILRDSDTIVIDKKLINLSIEAMNDFLSILDEKRYSSYSDWLHVLFALKCENNNKYFDCFDNFSKKWEKYDKYLVLENWNKHITKPNKHIFTYNSILSWAKQDNQEQYEKLCKKYNLFQNEKDDIFEFFDIKDEEKKKQKFFLEVEQEYLLMDKKLGSCNVSKFIDRYLNDENEKVLNVLSPYNTGKTSLLQELCSKFKTILFISYRITLTNNLIGNFKKLGFKTYFEHDFETDKLICQIDSLDRINNIYDLIIIDEVESVLNHFSGATLTYPKKTFDIMTDLCLNAKKIINLDGDISGRTLTFSKIFSDNFYFIKNSILKDKKHFVFHCEENIYNDLIKKDLQDGKNICIVSMSSKNASYYYNLYHEQYKTILYTAMTADKDKKLLADVQKIWSSHQLVIYSPCIEAGVDYNVEHFDKIYIVLSSGSTSQRGLNQMINRIRQVRDNTVHTFLNNIRPNELSIKRHYNLDEVITFYDTLIDKKEIIEKNNETHQMQIKNNLSFYDMILIYNKLEYLNKNSNCFLPIFIKMIQKKGHIYNFYDEENNTKVKTVKKENLVLERIVNAKSIDEDTYQKLLIEQSKHNLSSEQKYELQKFMYEIKFNIKINDVETIKKLYGKINSIKNFNNLCLDKYFNENETIMKLKELNLKYNTIKQILNIFNINPNDLKTKTFTIDYETLEKAIKPIDKIVADNKILFGLTKCIKIESTTKLLGTLNCLLDNYGIYVKSNRIGKKENGEKIFIKQYEFYLMEEIKNKFTVEDINFMFNL